MALAEEGFFLLRRQFGAEGVCADAAAHQKDQEQSVRRRGVKHALMLAGFPVNSNFTNPSSGRLGTVDDYDKIESLGRCHRGGRPRLSGGEACREGGDVLLALRHADHGADDHPHQDPLGCRF